MAKDVMCDPIIVQLPGERFPNVREAGSFEAVREADVVITKRGVVIKDRDGLIGRQATRDELLAAHQL